MYARILKVLRNEDTESELAQLVRQAFPYRDHLCNPQGELIWFEGEYSVLKHKAAYERSKQYFPIYKQGKLTWKPHKVRKKFYRLFSPKSSTFPKPIPKKNVPVKKMLVIGTVGTYLGKKAVIVSAQEKKYKRNTWVGIGDPECQFKNFGDSFPLKLGPHSKTVDTITWTAKTLEGNLKIDARKFKASNQVVCLDQVDNALTPAKIVISKPSKILHEPLKERIVQELCPGETVAKVQDEARRIKEATKRVNPYRSLQLARPDPPCKNCGHNNYINCHTHYVCRKCAVVRDMIHQGLPYRVMEDRDINTCGQQRNPLYSHAWHQQTTVIGDEKLNRMQQKMYYDRQDSQIFEAEETIKHVCNMLQLGDHFARTAHILYCKFRKRKTVNKPHVKIAACLLHAIDVHNHKRKR